MARNIDKYNLYDHILLNEGAYFFKRGNASISKVSIEELFSSVAKEQVVLARKVRVRETVHEKSVFCSLLVVKMSAIPSFLNEADLPTSTRKAVMETKLGYLLIVEDDDYIVIVKKNVSHLSSFLKTLEVIDGDVLSGILVNNTTEFQKMSLTNMNINDNGVRNKSVEANDLANVMSLFGANQNIATATRFVTDGEICTLNISTSSLAKFGSKKTKTELLEWIDDIASCLDTYVVQPTFLSRFAKPLSWKSMADHLEPNALLINVFNLQDFIESKLNDHTIYKKLDSDDYRNVTNAFYRLISRGDKTWALHEAQYRQTTCWVSEDEKLRVAKTSTKISLKAKGGLDKLYVKLNQGTYVKLTRIVTSNAFFSVSFQDCSYIYTGGRLYQNSSIKEDFDSILQILFPITGIENVTSEKGRGYNNDSTDFAQDSMFHVVETDVCANAQFVVCDDMGNEWADHIAINGDTISFIHSKCKGSSSLSASNFQEVIGQAIKNIGHLNPSNDELERKRESWNGTWQNTQIPNLRSGNEVGAFIDAFKALRVNPNRNKEVCLAIDFLSKGELVNAFEHIKQDVDFRQRNTVIQMVWILNAFISCCKEAGLKSKIYCRE